MSMFEDFFNDYAYELYNNKQYKIWTMRDGTEIEVKDMTTKHIRNCMRMVGENDEWYEIFEKELEKRNSNKGCS